MASPATFRSAADPRRVSAAEHSHPPGGKARLLGLEIAGVVVGYPIGLLDRAEVIDDQAADRAWVVARCALTHVAAVFDRSVDGRKLTFDEIDPEQMTIVGPLCRFVAEQWSRD